MRKKIVAVILSGVLVAGCDTFLESTLFGAGAGVVVATAVGGNPVTGAAIGAVGGAVCHESSIC